MRTITATEQMVSPSADRRAAILSALVPGLGQATHGQVGRAMMVVAVTLLLLALSWATGRVAGVSGAIFVLMLVGLPWWSIQAYDAWLGPQTAGIGFGRTLRLIWERAHDLRYLGALFLLTALTDFYIIVANPEYALTVFCQKPAGVLGILAKAQSPTLHTLIGYGFLRLRRWALFLYLVYATFGLVNGTVNYACFGYGRVRTVFLLSLLAFTAYILWRRDRFQPGPAARAL
jgi:hypothetical protein